MATLKFFKLHLRVPFLALAGIEFCICVAAVYLAIYVRFDGRGLDELNDTINSPVVTSLLFGFVMPITMLAMGLYQNRFRGGILGVFLRSVIGFLAGGVILALLYYLIPSLYLGRGIFALAVVIAFFMVGSIRPIFFYYVDKDVLKLRVLVLGAGSKADAIHQRLRRRVDRRGFRIVGFVPLPTDNRIAVDQDLVVDTGDSLLEFCTQNTIDEIVVAADERRSGMELDELLKCKLHGIDVIELLTFFEREQGKLPLDILRPGWLIYSDGFERGALRDVLKRGFDIAASLLILSITWPFMVLAILAIKLEDGFNAPVFYGQTRVGYLGATFEVLKFRSMSVNAEQAGQAQWATRNDSRVTRVGKFIRQTRIDELPQILNVLRGDMSFVGPRPERPQFVEQLTLQIPYYQERHAVKPGITGWAQVCYPYGSSLEDSVQKQEFDLYYIKNHTIFLDTLILCQTAEVVLFGKGAR